MDLERPRVLPRREEPEAASHTQTCAYAHALGQCVDENQLALAGRARLRLMAVSSVARVGGGFQCTSPESSCRADVASLGSKNVCREWGSSLPFPFGIAAQGDGRVRGRSCPS